MIRSTILTQINRIAEQQKKTLAALTDDLPLLQSGLDSLCFAMLVASLDDLSILIRSPPKPRSAFPLPLATSSSCTRTPLPDRRSLWDLTAAAGLSPARFVSDASGRTSLSPGTPAEAALRPGSTCSGAGRCSFHRDRQLPALLALLLLDGVARRILLCPPDLDPAHLPVIAASAGVDLIVSDGTGPAARAALDVPTLDCPTVVPSAVAEAWRGDTTEWLLFTSGTTGRPKIVVHTLATLTSAARRRPGSVERCDLEHVLRCSPLRRPADPVARAAWRRFAGAVAVQSSRCGLSHPCRPIGGHTYFGHAVALAPSPDERRRQTAWRRAMSAYRANWRTRRS